MVLWPLWTRNLERKAIRADNNNSEAKAACGVEVRTQPTTAASQSIKGLLSSAATSWNCTSISRQPPLPFLLLHFLPFPNLSHLRGSTCGCTTPFPWSFTHYSSSFFASSRLFLPSPSSCCLLLLSCRRLGGFGSISQRIIGPLHLPSLLAITTLFRTRPSLVLPNNLFCITGVFVRAYFDCQPRGFTIPPINIQGCVRPSSNTALGTLGLLQAE